jgi:phytol kinase
MNMQDILATAATLVLSLVWLRLIDALAHRGVLEQRLSRKIIHIGTGPLFVLCWNLFSNEPWARWLAALVPLAITLQFIGVGLGVIKDEAAVKAMTRTGNPREILHGPLYYGVIFVICTVAFWRTSPVGILALMLLCGGDGFADIIGRRFGSAKLPFSREKSWAGSAAMFLGSFVFAFAFVWLFATLGYYTLDVGRAFGVIALIALAATAVESLPYHDIDNITVTVVALVLGLLFL